MVQFDVITRRISRAHGIFQLVLRQYSTAQRKRIDWNIVFSPNSSKRRALNQFKKNLIYLVERGESPRAGSQEFQVVESLSGQGTRSTRKLYEMIIQHRINENEVWEAIVKANRRDLANITVPKKLKGHTNAHPKRQTLLKIIPQTVDHLEDVIDKVEKKRAVEPILGEKPIVFDELKSKDEKSTPNQSNVRDIDVESLGNYLQKAGKDGEMRRKYTWESPRKFSWEQATNEPFNLSPGEVLFPSAMYKRYKTKPLESIKRKASSVLSPDGRGLGLEKNTPTELLIYNLVSRKERVIPLTNDNSLFNINYKDLFGIINSSKNAPEEMLNAINEFESKGWKLVGDLYDNSQTIAFQRAVASNTQNTGKPLAKNPWLWTALLSALLFSSYNLGYLPFTSSNRLTDKDSTQDGK